MSIVKKMLDNLPLRLLKKMKFLPQAWYVGYSYENFTGKKLNLENPVEFNEKIQWLKVFYHRPILTQLVDKYAVRSYVKDKIGIQYLNECIGIYDNAKEIEFEKLPSKFVIKATQASGYNLIVPDKSKVNWFRSKLTLNRWLRTSQYYRTGLEWAYKNVKPRLTVEKFLKEEGKEVINDYKFYCFNGTPKFIQVDKDRGIEDYKYYFDLNWEKLPFFQKRRENIYDGKFERPDTLEKMIELAAVLAKGFPFVRVDFYSINGVIIFGEMTFYPGDGKLDFVPDEYNKIIGDYLILPKIPEGQSKITFV